MPSPVRVFVVDDHLVVREGLRLILESEPDFEWVGEAEHGRAFLDQVEDAKPHVVLMDVRMPVMGGLEALRQVRGKAPEIGVVMLTTFDEEDQLVGAIRGGARGYLLKDADRDTILEGIRAAARGEVLLGSEVLETVLARPADPKGAGPGMLTQREEEVLSALGEGSSNKRIAQRLGISERTVKAHLTNIYQKLGVETRTAAVARALRDGLLEPSASDE